MSQEFLTIIVILVAGFGFLFWFVSQKFSALQQGSADEEKTKDIVNQVFGEVSDKVINQAKHILQSDKEAIYKDTEGKRKAIEKLVQDLKVEIDQRQDEIRKLEQDRNKKFGEIEESIREHRKITTELKTSTQSLSKMLSNNQVRGQWGERIIEDILNNAGSRICSGV